MQICERSLQAANAIVYEPQYKEKLRDSQQLQELRTNNVTDEN